MKVRTYTIKEHYGGGILIISKEEIAKDFTILMELKLALEFAMK